ncbi:hypothetical protein ORI20_06690 [Mycobacterium sp. CVI_P3]|uniref:DUF4386 domain-containing protein n=1 Tax=Mycobacterium pinniadriaticum TaxID=2994102 RepID=A0ABT3SB67_9MYCO|nr:hypothetical protein [Mycobacterium pinniadriaticum]MCX2929952.1 hypothetical protein [Mycobacterium pinniadriaticum]MCX2936399.1 hypothetical protein [Mycobacterium pinniadriaticum]
MDTTAQRLCAWSGIACIAVFFVGFWLVAGFIPPPAPTLSGEQLAQLFTEDAVRIRLGMIISLLASALLASWSAAITAQMMRMKRRVAALAYTNLAVGALFVLEFIISLIIWESMTFRPRDPQVLLAMNDTAWLLFVAITSTPILQTLSIGTAIFLDSAGNPNPVLPRWAGYLNFWVAMLFLPGSITVFFHTGPFAWNGLLVWYLALTAFAVWMVVMSILVLRAIAAEDAAQNPTAAEQIRKERAR